MLSKETIANRGDHEFYALARLRRGVTMEQARTELDSIQHRLWEANGKGTFGRGATVSLLADRIIGHFQETLRVLFGAVACVLLIACVNIANLLLARGSQRQREVAIRAALGARWSRLVRQLLTEAVSLSLAGAALGLLLASFLTDYLAARAKILLNSLGDFDAAATFIWMPGYSSSRRALHSLPASQRASSRRSRPRARILPSNSKTIAARLRQAAGRTGSGTCSSRLRSRFLWCC